MAYANVQCDSQVTYYFTFWNNNKIRQFNG